MNFEDLENLILSRVKPYEDRIQKLEESERSKELEIITLKHAIHNLNRIIDNLRSQPTQHKTAPTSATLTTTTTMSKSSTMIKPQSATTQPLKDQKLKENALDGKNNRPQTAVLNMGKNEKERESVKAESKTGKHVASTVSKEKDEKKKNNTNEKDKAKIVKKEEKYKTEHYEETENNEEKTQFKHNEDDLKDNEIDHHLETMKVSELKQEAEYVDDEDDGVM